MFAFCTRLEGQQKRKRESKLLRVFWGGYRTSTSNALQGGKGSERGGAGIAPNWPC